MSLDHALWIHGHSAEIEYPNRILPMVQKGYYARIEGKPSTTNWLHLAIPTPTVADDQAMRAAKVWVRYKTYDGASVGALHVYDGENKIAETDQPTGHVDSSGWSRVGLEIEAEQDKGTLSVRWAIGISIQLTFDATGGKVGLASAGCDFEFATRIASQRLPVGAMKTLEFPYRSNMPLDVPNEAVTRILIALHGTGGNADHYLQNGIAATQAAVAAGVDPQALVNTLIIAPQYINSDEYHGTFPGNLVYWQGGLSTGGESVERDLDGDGIADSGRLSSFTIMDTLIERVSRRSLFPNLQTIVLAGQSRGGRFLSRYAPTTRVEQRTAAPRGIHVRYAVMSAGAYLYLNEMRQAFLGDAYKAAAYNEDWRNTIVSLVDFSSLCKVDTNKFNDWPVGLNDLWPYPAALGADQIRQQFGGRDVHYLVGEHDLSASFPECPERVQGPDTLAKCLLYYRHLELVYGPTLQHHLHVVPNVDHSGLGIMTSPQGLTVLFGN